MIELLIATLLLGLVLLAATSMYVAGWRFLNISGENAAYLRVFAAMEQITRKAALSNEAYSTNGNEGVKIRWDYQIGNYLPNHTPDNPSDDSWVKYRYFADGTLRWRNDTSAAPDVAVTDPEVDEGLVLTAGSFIAMSNPSGQGVPGVLNINLVSSVGNPPRAIELNTDVAIGAMSKN